MSSESSSSSSSSSSSDDEKPSQLEDRDSDSDRERHHPAQQRNEHRESSTEVEPQEAAATRAPDPDNESGSERSHASPSPSPTKRRLIDSDEEDQSAEASRTLFGAEVSSDSDDVRGDARKPRKAVEDDDSDAGSRKSDDSIHGIRMYPDEDAEQEEEQAPTTIEATMSKMNIDYGQEGGPMFCKFPNFLSVETRPFSEEHYDEDEDDDNIDDEGRSRLKLKVENTLRWRSIQTPEGEKRESNAKVVRWSDGSATLYLGSEKFDIQMLPMSSNTHLYIRQGAGLVGQAVFDQRINFRPHSTDSKTHRKVTLNMADRSRKSGQVKMISDVGNDPAEAQKEAQKREDELLRATIRRETKQRRAKDKSRGGLSSGYLEGRDDSDEDARPARGRREAPLIGHSDSDESDDDGKRLEGAKDDSEDSDEEFFKKKQQLKKTIADSEDEESD